MEKLRSLAVAAILCLATAVPGAQGPREYDEVVIERDTKIPARDGIVLATDIYRPAHQSRPVSERLPILLHRTPYDKQGEGLVRQAHFFARQGYVVAVQDTRGRYKSGGVFSKYYRYDALDGYDTIEWLARLPYTDGRVGMWGTSYAAHTQADAAKMNPPALKTLVLNEGGMANAWDHAVRHGGAFELGRELTWAFTQIPAESGDPVVRKYFEREKVQDWYAALPLRKGLNPLSIAPNFEDYFLEELTHADYDDFWKGLGLNWAEYYDRTADIPMLHIGGWYDIFLRGTVDNFVNLGRLKKSPMRLIVGPWTHGGNSRTYAGDVDFGPGAALKDFTTVFHLRWFDHYLKGRPTGAELDKPVRLFVMGTGDGHKDGEGRMFHGGYWIDADGWPLPGTEFTRYYFHDGGNLSIRPPAAGASATPYTFDPRDPVPTVGGNVSGRLKDGAFDQREHPDFYGSRPPYLPLKARSDVVVFQTEPLTEDLAVIGPIEVRLFASSTAVDTDFTAKLIDVYPPSDDFPSGFDMNLADALVRASYRDSRPQRELIRPGQVYEFVIRPFPTANVFKKGHRIRVDISSSNFPRFDVNPNSGEPLGRNRRMMAADNTVYHDAAHPSLIILPVAAGKR